MLLYTKQEGGTALYLMHRMPAMQGTSVSTALDQCGLALAAGFDGCYLPTGTDPAETMALDGFALAALLARIAPVGRIVLPEMSLSILPPDEILRRTIVLANIAPNRVELGLSLGRPNDLRAANVHCGRARKDFPILLQAFMQALSGKPDPAVSINPTFRALPTWPLTLPRPEVFISGTYCAENRTATKHYNLPWLTYGDPFDKELKEAIPVHDLVLKVDFVSGSPAARCQIMQEQVPPGYYDAEEYRTRLQAPLPAVLFGTPVTVAEQIKELARPLALRRLIIDPAAKGLDRLSMEENFTKVIEQLLPALRG